MKMLMLILGLLMTSQGYCWNLLNYADEDICGVRAEDSYYTGYNDGVVQGWCDAVYQIHKAGATGIPEMYVKECILIDALEKPSYKP